MFTRALACGLLLLLFGGCAASTEQAQKANPHFTLGLSHLQGGNPTLALKEFLLARDASPNDPQVHAGLARAYQSKKAYDLAEKEYFKALELSDNKPEYQNNLGALYISMERWDQAIEYFSKAASNLLFMRSELALMGKGYAYYRKGDYPSALEAYREAEAIAPRMAPLHFHKGEVFAAMGHAQLAKEAYKNALVYAPDYSEARYQLAVLQLKEQQIEEAKKNLARIAEKDSQSEWGLKAAEFLRALK